MGYAKAGFEVTGVDIVPRGNYPLEFVQGSAMEILADTDYLDRFDVVHASPPCQLFTRTGHLARAQGRKPGGKAGIDLLTPTLAALKAWGGVWIVENVPGAPMPGGVKVCGTAFALSIQRHRIFTSNRRIYGTLCRHAQAGRPIGVYHMLGDDIPNGGRTAKTKTEAAALLGVTWPMTWKEMAQIVPPVYTAYLGRQLLNSLKETP
jgi:DNA (cytosine-5)-methyltransferase 1